ncbi:hypothetical protein BBJ28_00013707 [Nothophytophthora sp. Chile5]|nr:hypothetical protein BBJ28_00013707 [Nothophytophthora sp. Chile5]
MIRRSQSQQCSSYALLAFAAIYWFMSLTSGSTVHPSRELATTSTSGSEDGAALPVNGSFSFDGSTSDIARQLYLRHAAGESIAKVAPNTMPNAVTERLETLGVSYSDLPGLLQRAVLWDCGFVITPENDAVQVRTLGGRSMAQLAVSKLEFGVTGCTAFNCSQPNNETYYANEFCTGTQMLTAAKCLIEAFGSDASEYLAMWSNGGDPDVTPEIRAVKHAWLDSSSNESYVVYAVHTMRVDSEPSYGSCNSGGYGSLVVPCYGTRGASVEVLAVMTQPVASPWVTTWFKTYQSTTEATVGQTSSESAGFDLLLLVPIVCAALSRRAPPMPPTANIQV